MRIHGLYCLTDTHCCTPEGAGRVQAALQGGARVLQIRCKDGTIDSAWAHALVTLGHQYDALVLINDDPVLAAQVEADGVHLGATDPAYSAARRLLGRRAVIGVSCYADLGRAQAMAEAGADYLAFGSFFPSHTKPHAVRASPSLLREAKVFGKPLVAIGGILPENGQALIAAGADALAVIDGVFGQTDIMAAARRYADLFEET